MKQRHKQKGVQGSAVKKTNSSKCTCGSDSERREHGHQRKDGVGVSGAATSTHTGATWWKLDWRGQRSKGQTPKDSLCEGLLYHRKAGSAGGSQLWSGKVTEFWGDNLYFLREVGKKVQC